jgi:hypothetical protein
MGFRGQGSGKNYGREYREEAEKWKAEYSQAVLAVIASI